MSGLNDWSGTTGKETHVWVAHASADVAALGLYAASWVVRRSGRRGRGKALGLVGSGVSVTGAYLGGHLSFVRAVKVNRTAFEDRPRE